MNTGEIFHAVLKVTHVAKEVFGEVFDGFHGWCWGQGWTGCAIGRVGVGGDCGWWGGVSGYKGGDQEAEEDEHEG